LLIRPSEPRVPFLQRSARNISLFQSETKPRRIGSVIKKAVPGQS
jgi:hypothetical protein